MTNMLLLKVKNVQKTKQIALKVDLEKDPIS